MRNQHNNTPDEKVKKYFKTFDAQLFLIPRRKSAEIRQEIRQHFDDLVADHEALGATKASAIDTALEQMGNPATLGRELANAYFLSFPSACYDILALYYTFQIALTIYGWILVLGPMFITAIESDPTPLTRLGSALWSASVFTVPILAGLIMGLVFPRRAPYAMLCAIPLWYLLIWDHTIVYPYGYPNHWQNLFSPQLTLVIWVIAAQVSVTWSTIIRRRRHLPREVYRLEP